LKPPKTKGKYLTSEHVRMTFKKTVLFTFFCFTGVRHFVSIINGWTQMKIIREQVTEEYVWGRGGVT
jgi:hypothetical protein